MIPITHNPFMMYIAIKTSLQIMNKNCFRARPPKATPDYSGGEPGYHCHCIIKKLTSQLKLSILSNLSDKNKRLIVQITASALI